MANLLSTNVSGRLYVSTQSDVNSTGGAFRFYDGSTFRGGLGLDDWAHAGSAANITMYVNGDNNFFISTSGVKRAQFNSGAALFRTYSADTAYNIRITGGDQFNAYYNDSAATLYLQYHNGNGGTLNVANGKLTVNTAGSVVASGDMRAPIFYDSNNTDYYLDPNSSTSGYFAGTLRQNNGKYVRDSSYRTISGYSDYYSGGDAGWYRVAEITLTSNCTGAVLYGTLYDHRYDGADAYQISIVARAECDFTSNNESHYINVGCTILGSTAFSSYQSKIRVLLVASSSNSRTYEVQFYETNWNHDTWQLETTGWTVYSSPQAPRSSTGTARVNYISNQNADYQRANAATYSPIYYDSQDTGYYLDPNGTSNLLKLSERTMGFNGMNPKSASSPYESRFNASVGYRNGTMGYGNTDFNTIARNWGSGFIDTWSSPANAPGGSTHYIGLQGVHYSDGGTSFYGFQMACAGESDNRFFWRSSWPSMRSWVEMIHSGNIASQSVSYADESGYSASSGSVEWTSVQNKPSLMPLSGIPSGSDQYVNLRVIRNSNAGSGSGMHIGYGNQNGGDTLLYGGGGTSAQLYVYGDHVYSPSSFRAPIFYDSADTSYYVDPNSYSRIYRTSTHFAPSPGVGSSNWVNDFNATPTSSMSFGGDLSSGGPQGTWWFQQNFRHSNSSNYWGTQVAWGWEDNANELWQRNVTGGNWSGWVRYLNSNNYGAYAVPITGTVLTEGNYFYFRSNRGSYLGSLDSPSLQAYATGGNAAFMSFHRAGSYAVNFGLDADNVMRIGGWSAAANRWVLDMSGNNTVAGSFRAPIFYSSVDTNYFWEPNVSSAHRFRTANGYVDIGPMNGSWCHFQTDRANFYFGSTIYADASGFATYGGSTSMTKTDINSPIFLVPNHSDNTKGYRIYNTSNSSVSAMFVNSSNQLVIAAGAVDQINLNKKVYVNGVALGVNVAPSATAGRIDASNDIVAYSSSDERLKYNIAPIENALDKVKSLTGVEFDWKPEYKHAHGYEGHDTGIIAQQVEAVMPSAVRTNDTGFLAVRYEKLIGLLIEANKELAARVEELEKKLG